MFISLQTFYDLIARVFTKPDVNTRWSLREFESLDASHSMRVITYVIYSDK